VENEANPWDASASMDSEQTSREIGGRGNLALAASGWEPMMKIIDSNCSKERGVRV